MPFPFDAYRVGQGGQFIRGLQKYVVKPANNELKKKDNEATVRNHGGDRATIDEATYVEGKK